MHRDLDYYVEIVGKIFAGWNFIQTHNAMPLEYLSSADYNILALAEIRA